MNLFSQGIDPQINFSNIDEIKRTVEYCNQIPVHERHPYGGDLVFTAFSGSHQDAINKGLNAMKSDALAEGVDVDSFRWQVPYLPIDPQDLGRTYEAVIRVNSQSGKGGVGFLLEAHYGVTLPRDILVEFSTEIQQLTERLGREIKTSEIYDQLLTTYANEEGPYKLVDYDLLTGKTDEQRCIAKVEVSENVVTVDGEGGGPIEAFVNALVATLNEPLAVVDYHEHALGEGSDAQAICILAIDDGERGDRCYGIGVSRNTIRASLNAIISAMNRRWAKV